MINFQYTKPLHRQVLPDPYTELLVRKFEGRFFEDFVPEGFEKQKAALRLLTDQDSDVRYLLYGGAAGGGKSFTGWLWLILNCLAYPETAWFFSREQLKDARKYGGQTFREVIKKTGIPSSFFRYNGSDNFYYCTATGSYIYLLSAKQNPSDSDFAGLGSTLFTGGFMEECGQHPNHEAFDTLKSRINRYYNDRYNLKGRIFKTANPAKNYLYKDFYLPNKSGKLEGNKQFISALVTDNPSVSHDYIASLDDMSKAKKQRLRYGNWEYDDDESILLTYDQILAIWKNSHVLQNAGGTYISADIALQGSDKFVIGVWNGFALIHCEIIPKIGAKEVEEKIRDLAYRYNVPEYRIVFDGDGLGNYLSGYLELAKSFKNGATPVDGNVKGTDTRRIKEEYKNLKSQCYFRLADMIKEGKIFIQCDLGQDTETLKEELEHLKDRSYGTEDKLEVLRKIEIKQIIGRSPDISDMLMMRMYFTLHNHLSSGLDISYFTS